MGVSESRQTVWRRREIKECIELKERILSALVFVPVLLLFMYLGGMPFALLVLALGTIGVHEFYTMAKTKHQVLFWPMLLGVWIMLISSYLQVSNWLTLGILVTFCLVFGYAVFRFPAFDVVDIAVNFLGLIYVGWTLAHLILLGGMPDGRVLVLFAFVAMWANDSGAYFVGITLGKRRPWGEISPKKSVEGAIGGIITTCVALFLLNLYFGLMHSVTAILIGVAVAIIGLIGDLMESLIKRYYGVKDSGKLIPGHGGILDRFDSVMLAAPMMYYCILLAQFLKQFAGFGV